MLVRTGHWLLGQFHRQPLLTSKVCAYPLQSVYAMFQHTAPAPRSYTSYAAAEQPLLSAQLPESHTLQHTARQRVTVLTLNSCVCPVTRMSTPICRCRIARASLSPQGTTWWPWHTPTLKSAICSTCGATHTTAGYFARWYSLRTWCCVFPALLQVSDAGWGHAHCRDMAC